jgi:hypothetical protein
VLPSVRVVSNEEIAGLHRYASQGGKVVLTGVADEQLDSLHEVTRLPDSPEVKYLSSAEKDFVASDPASESDLLKAISTSTGVEVRASKNVVVHEARIGDRVYLFFANFDGLQAGLKATPAVQQDIEVRVPMRFGDKLRWLPFMGSETLVDGQPSQEELRFRIPTLDRGAVAWFTSTSK